MPRIKSESAQIGKTCRTKDGKARRCSQQEARKLKDGGGGGGKVGGGGGRGSRQRDPTGLVRGYGKLKTSANKYMAHSGDVDKIRGFHMKHSPESTFLHNHPGRNRELASHIAGRSGKEAIKQFQGEATGGTTVRGFDPQNPQNTRMSSRLGQTDTKVGLMSPEVAVGAAALRATGLPVPHDGGFSAHFDPRDPMRSSIGLYQGDQETNVSVGGMVKRGKNDVNKAAKSAKKAAHRMGL